MSKYKDWIVVLIIVVLSITVWHYVFCKKDIVVDDSRLIELQLEYDRLWIQYGDLQSYADSILCYSDYKLDSVNTVKTKLIRNYEDRIKNLYDVTVVDHDSITKFISSRIYNR